MMSRELGGVVNAELTVYGTTNIRVVDAAAIPLQTNGHLYQRYMPWQKRQPILSVAATNSLPVFLKSRLACR